MKNVKSIFIITATSLCLIGISSCKEKAGQGKEQTSEQTKSPATISKTLFDKSLPEIKELIDGKWELVSGQNAGQLCEFENTFITFNGDKYIWSEEGKDEPGNLNWRKADTGAGYESYLMDVFYETNPAYPLSLHGDTLFIQDCTETAYKYKLVRNR